MRAAAAVVAVVAALAVAGSARAAAPWSPPATIAGTRGVAFASILFTRAGGALAVADLQRRGRVRVVGALAAPGRTTFGPARRVAPPNVLVGPPFFGGVAPFGARGVLVLGTRFATGPHRGNESRPWLGTAVAGRPLRSRGSLGAAHGFSLTLDVSANRRGDVAGLFLECNRTCGRQRLMLLGWPSGAVRPRVRRVATVSANADDFARGAVALDSRGRLVVAYAGDRLVGARRGTLRGRLGSPQRLARPRRPVETMSAKLAEAGTALVGWVEQMNVEDVQAASFYAAVAPARGKPFGARQTLERWPDTATADMRDMPLRTLASGDGRMSVGWTGFQAGHYVARVADLAGTTVGAPQTLAVPGRDVALTDLEASASGHAIVAAELGDPGRGFARSRAVLAAERAAGAPAFGPLVTLSDGSALAGDARVAFDPLGGRAVAVWPDGRGRERRLRTAALAGP